MARQMCDWLTVDKVWLPLHNDNTADRWTASLTFIDNV